MKKTLIILAGITFLLSCNSADKTAVDDVAKSAKDGMASNDNLSTDATMGSQTAIQWLDSTYLDLGKVKKGKEVEVSFRFKNTGDKPLVITNVTAACGCTVPEKPEKPYAAGEEGVIKAKFDSKNQAVGEHRKHVTVTANTTPESVHTLNFRVEVTQ
jgi:hypothetical protein